MVFNKVRSIIKRISNPEIVIVSGLPRSGTSMMMEMLQAGGFPLLTDHLREADDDNPRGYFEYEKVKKLVDGEKAWLSTAIGKAVKVIAPLLSHLPDEYRYKVIYMKRDMEEILSSQREMLQRRRQDPEEVGEERIRDIFYRNQNAVIRFMNEKANFSYLICDYNEILRDPIQTVEQIKRYLDLHVDIQRMVEVVDPALYRQRSKEASS